MVIGPKLSPGLNATMKIAVSWLNGARSKSSNDSMSVIDVRDCAALHVAAYEQETAKGRYMCII